MEIYDFQNSKISDFLGYENNETFPNLEKINKKKIIYENEPF